jgi:two-component sensor histidine kinase
MILRKIVLLGTFVLLANIGQSAKIDSLKRILQKNILDTSEVNVLLDIAKYYVKVSPDSAIQYAEKANTKANEINFIKGIWSSNEIIGNAYFITNEYELGIGHYNEALKWNKDPRIDAKIKLNLGNSYLFVGQEQKGLELFLQLIDYFKSISDSNKLGDTYASIGGAFYMAGDSKNAIDYLSKAVTFSSLENDPQQYAVILRNLGAAQIGTNAVEEGLENIKKSSRILEEREITFELMANYINLGAAYGNLGLDDSVTTYMILANNLAKELGNPLYQIYSYRNIALANLNKKEYQLAIINYQKALEISDDQEPTPSVLQNQVEIYNGLAIVYEELGKFDKAYSYLNQLLNYKDSLNQMESSIALQDLEKKYQSVQKDAEIALLNEKEAKSKVEIEKRSLQNKITFFTAIFLALIGIISLFFWRKNSRLNHNLVRKTDALQEALGENEILLKETHHRVKNNLQMISSLLNLQANQEADPSIVDALKEGQNRVKSVALIHEKLYQNESLAQIDFKEYIENLSNHLFMLQRNNAELKLDINNILVDMDTAIPLGLIINELLTNSLKYALNQDNRVINLSLIKEEDYLLIYDDHGPGIPEDFDIKKSDSLGMKLIHMLSRQITGTINIDPIIRSKFQISFKDAYFRKNKSL